MTNMMLSRNFAKINARPSNTICMNLCTPKSYIQIQKMLCLYDFLNILCGFCDGAVWPIIPRRQYWFIYHENWQGFKF